MKTLTILFSVGLCASVSAVSAQETILYLTFDEAADVTDAADGDPYTPGASEIVGGTVANPLNIITEYKNRLGSGPDIGAVPTLTDGTNLQGGKALLLNNGDSNGGGIEGLRLISDNEIPSQDFTMEVVWWTDTVAPSENLLGLQYPAGSETAFAQEKPAFFIRHYDNNGTLTMQYWNDNADGDNSQGIQILGANSLTASTAYHDVISFQFNAADPSTSTVSAYRNGVLVGSATYDATNSDNILFGTRGDFDTDGEPDRLFAIGYNAADDPPSGDQERGVVGGVDAFAFTAGAALDGTAGNEFVLPGGTPYLPTVASHWSIYE